MTSCEVVSRVELRAEVLPTRYAAVTRMRVCVSHTLHQLTHFFFSCVLLDNVDVLKGLVSEIDPRVCVWGEQRWGMQPQSQQKRQLRKSCNFCATQKIKCDGMCISCGCEYMCFGRSCLRMGESRRLQSVRQLRTQEYRLSVQVCACVSTRGSVEGLSKRYSFSERGSSHKQKQARKGPGEHEEAFLPAIHTAAYTRTTSENPESASATSHARPARTGHDGSIVRERKPSLGMQVPTAVTPVRLTRTQTAQRAHT
jgi:hypothetical protein